MCGNLHPHHHTWKTAEGAEVNTQSTASSDTDREDSDCGQNVSNASEADAHDMDVAGEVEPSPVIHEIEEDHEDEEQQSTKASEQHTEGSCPQFHIGDEDVKPSVCAGAMSMLLDHPDENIRLAAQQAMNAAAAQSAEPGFVSLSSGDLSSDSEWEQFDEWEQV